MMMVMVMMMVLLVMMMMFLVMKMVQHCSVLKQKQIKPIARLAHRVKLSLRIRFNWEGAPLQRSLIRKYKYFLIIISMDKLDLIENSLISKNLDELELNDTIFSLYDKKLYKKIQVRKQYRTIVNFDKICTV